MQVTLKTTEGATVSVIKKSLAVRAYQEAQITCKPPFKDEHGKLLRPGPYTIHVTAYTATGDIAKKRLRFAIIK